MTTRNILLLTAVPIAALAILPGTRYAGDWSVFLLFTLTANALLFNGFRSQTLFFDTFVGLWLKLSLRGGDLQGDSRRCSGLARSTYFMRFVSGRSGRCAQCSDAVGRSVTTGNSVDHWQFEHWSAALTTTSLDNCG